jgi:hypothetical protein
MSARGCQKMGGLASDSTEAEQIVHHLPVKFTPEGIEFFGPLLFFLPAKLPFPPLECDHLCAQLP